MYFNQRKYILNPKFRYSYLIILLVIGVYAYISYQNILEKNQNIYKNELVNYYQIFRQLYKEQQKESILIKNFQYIDNKELIDELSQSTPIFINKESKLDNQFNIIFTFYKKELLPNDIKTNLHKIEDNCYIIKNDDTIYKLIGKIDNKGYVSITKYIDNNQLKKEHIKEHFRHISIFLLINILLFFYFSYTIKKSNEYEKYLTKEYQKLQIDTKKLAFEDTLTKAATRLKFNESLNNLIQIANRFKDQSFTLIIIDIDNFKTVNDTYGHDYGDLVLKSISHIIKKDIRSIDIFARWGGEEFVILLPLTNKNDAIKLANRIRKNISNYRFTKVNKVTCSFGLTQFIQNDTEESILKRADELLYQAKKTGKNKVVY